MKFKYMIRGMGIGVVITAAVMGAYSRNAVADARVAVLREYGLGDESRLVDETQDPEDVSAAAPTDPVIMRDEEREAEIYSVLDAAKESEMASEEQPSDENTETAASGSEISSVESSESSSAIIVTPSGEGEASDETIDIVIASGDDSGTVARKLYNAGIIENASEYDAFLTQHGYDKRLSTGTKTISVSDSWQDIADKITR